MDLDRKIEKIIIIVCVVLISGSIVVLSQSLQQKNQSTSTRASDNTSEQVRYKDEVFTEFDAQKNLSYSSKGGRDYQLDLYEPKGDVEVQRPAVIWIHGGGFVGGSKEIMAPYAQSFAKRGYVAITINYRLEEGQPVPVLKNMPDLSGFIKQDLVKNAETDAQTAVRWLRTNAQTYRVDPDKIFVGGSSAGAITALLVGYDYENAPSSEYPGVAQAVSGVVSIAGATDPTTLSKDDPRLIMFHGDQDRVVPYSFALKVKDVAVDLGIIVNEETDFKDYPGEMHGLKDHKDEIMRESARVFYEVLNQTPGTTLSPDPSQPTQNPLTPTTDPNAPIADLSLPDDPDQGTAPTYTANEQRFVDYLNKHKNTACRRSNNDLLIQMYARQYKLTIQKVRQLLNQVCRT